jgi:NTP pyrophosphatase (non-canonical NTP hydrolase)
MTAKKPARRRADQIGKLLEIMAQLRGPDGCPWDREQTHASLRYQAVEEVYEMIDAIEAQDDDELKEELGDLLLHVVFHAQLAAERGAFDFNGVVRALIHKLIHRHPHVFGNAKARTAAAVWEQWDRLKSAEKAGTSRERSSALEGIPRHLPALLYAQKLWKKASRAGLAGSPPPPTINGQPLADRSARRQAAEALFELARFCQDKGWCAEELLRQEAHRRKQRWQRDHSRGSGK